MNFLVRNKGAQSLRTILENGGGFSRSSLFKRGSGTSPERRHTRSLGWQPSGPQSHTPGSPTRGDGAQPLPRFPQLGSSGWEKIFPEV